MKVPPECIIQPCNKGNVSHKKKVAQIQGKGKEVLQEFAGLLHKKVPIKGQEN